MASRDIPRRPRHRVPGAGRIHTGQDQYEVSTFGPRNLWAEVSNAYLRWCSLGRPDRDRYGIAITPDNGGQTRVWLDHPAQVISTP
jgi:hypothetical protein